ncbi:MAG TPA: hypothetical protein DCR93_04500, partial [Cytophagales bacterium]|nr:hypothetical protein [Cytophagales bacterium]
ALSRLSAVNKGDEPITEMLFTMPTTVTAEVVLPAGAEQLEDNEQLRFQRYQLAEPLAPGDTLHFEVRSHFAPKGIRDGGTLTELVSNGTFLNHLELVPVIGYDR